MSVFRRVVLGLAAFLAVFATTAAAAAHPVAHKAAVHKVVARKAAARPAAIRQSAPAGQQCPGGIPGPAPANASPAVGPFDPNVGGYYINLSAGTIYCVPAGWEVLTMQALPGNPVYGVRVGDQQWVNWTYTGANGQPVNPYSGAAYTATPHPVASWVLLGYQG